MTMRDKPNDLLLLAGKVLTIIMQAVMVIGIAALTIAFFGTLFFSDYVVSEIQADQAEALTEFPKLAVLGLLLLGAAVVGTAFVFFGKLRQIINTVGEGDPFVPENADRLNMMAWMLLGIYLLGGAASGVALFVANWVRQIEDAQFTVAGGFDLTSILMIIILFILARVFKHGAEMREDLEGTV